MKFATLLCAGLLGCCQAFNGEALTPKVMRRFLNLNQVGNLLSETTATKGTFGYCQSDYSWRGTVTWSFLYGNDWSFLYGNDCHKYDPAVSGSAYEYCGVYGAHLQCCECNRCWRESEECWREDCFQKVMHKRIRGEIDDGNAYMEELMTCCTYESPLECKINALKTGTSVPETSCVSDCHIYEDGLLPSKFWYCIKRNKTTGLNTCKPETFIENPWGDGCKDGFEQETNGCYDIDANPLELRNAPLVVKGVHYFDKANYDPDFYKQYMPDDWLSSGNCQVDGACVTSPNFPNNYSVNDKCDIISKVPSKVNVESFDLEDGFDFLDVVRNCGSDDPNFIDPYYGGDCKEWVGYDCPSTMGDVEELLNACPESCCKDLHLTGEDYKDIEDFPVDTMRFTSDDMITEKGFKICKADQDQPQGESGRRLLQVGAEREYVTTSGIVQSLLGYATKGDKLMPQMGKTYEFKFGGEVYYITLNSLSGAQLDGTAVARSDLISGASTSFNNISGDNSMLFHADAVFDDVSGGQGRRLLAGKEKYATFKNNACGPGKKFKLSGCEEEYEKYMMQSLSTCSYISVSGASALAATYLALVLPAAVVLAAF